MDNQKSHLNVIDSDKWYKEGLSFKCTGCGKCCTGSPGYVWVQVEEVEQMADFLKITVSDFTKRYLRELNGRLALKERVKTYDCIFLDGTRCKIYSERPKQCRTFPWWQQNLNSKEDWEEAAKHCEGINHPEALLVAFEEIDKQLKSGD